MAAEDLLRNYAAGDPSDNRFRENLLNDEFEVPAYCADSVGGFKGRIVRHVFLESRSAARPELLAKRSGLHA